MTTRIFALTLGAAGCCLSLVGVLFFYRGMRIDSEKCGAETQISGKNRGITASSGNGLYPLPLICAVVTVSVTFAWGYGKLQLARSEVAEAQTQVRSAQSQISELKKEVEDLESSNKSGSHQTRSPKAQTLSNPPPSLKSGDNPRPGKHITENKTINLTALNQGKEKFLCPPAATQEGLDEDVVVDIVVGEDGNVQTAVVRQGSPLLREAAIDYAKRIRYKPFHIDGQHHTVRGVTTVYAKCKVMGAN